MADTLYLEAGSWHKGAFHLSQEEFDEEEVEGIPLWEAHSLASAHVLPNVPLGVEDILLLVEGRKKEGHTHILQDHQLNDTLLLLVEGIPCLEFLGFYDGKQLCLQVLDWGHTHVRALSGPHD